MNALLFVLAALLAGPPAWSEPAPTSPTGAAAQAPAPKKRIAVEKFDANGAFVAQYGGWDIGGGLAAQLTTALVNSGRFIVVERPDLAGVLKEQELSQAHITASGSGPQTGRLVGAQLLVRGSVTEFTQAANGGGMNFGVSNGGGFGNLIGAGIATKKNEGVVAMDIRLIDATTGQVLQSRRVEKRIASSDTGMQLTASQVAFGSDKFNNSVLGQATRAAIDDAVAAIVAWEAETPWTGAVADVEGQQVYINAGSEDGLGPGDRLEVVVVVKDVTDPATGVSLGQITNQAGILHVTTVQPKFSIAVMEQPFTVKKGDLVRFLGR